MALPLPTPAELAWTPQSRSFQKVLSPQQLRLWAEPFNTPGLVPVHMKRMAASRIPILELIQRFFYKFKLRGPNIETFLAILGCYHALHPLFGQLKQLCLWAFTVQVTIPENDPIAKDVLAWVGSEVIMRRHARDAMLVTGGRQDAINDDYHFNMMSTRSLAMGIKPSVGSDKALCLPPLGTKLFWIGYRPFIFSRRGGPGTLNASPSSSTGVRNQLHNSIQLTTLGWSLTPLQEFAEMCRAYKKATFQGTTNVYFVGKAQNMYGGGWQSVSKAVRKLETVDMDEDIKKDIVQDAAHYYSSESRQYFADCGIPYRRGYLFYGPPGTGKSSFSAALAGNLGCDIYHINLAGLGDSELLNLFLGLPQKCVVVIEDIDSAGIGREQTTLPDSNRMARRNERDIQNRPMSKSVTLSGLLNAIDGNASHEGRLLIMTSNDPNALDSALTRPGRIDKKVHFGRLSQVGAQNMFKRLMGPTARAPDSTTSMEQIDQYAISFAEEVPAEVFTRPKSRISSKIAEEILSKPSETLEHGWKVVPKQWSCRGSVHGPSCSREGRHRDHCESELSRMRYILEEVGMVSRALFL